MLGFGLGAAIRHTAGALSTFYAVLFALFGWAEVHGIAALAVMALWLWGFPALRRVDRLKDVEIT